MKKTIVIHPLLFAIFPIIFLFSHNVNRLYAEEIVLPLLYSIIGSIIIWIALGFLIKSRIKSGFIVSVGLVLFFSYGHIFMLLNPYFPWESLKKDFLFYHTIVLIPLLILFGMISYYFIKTNKPLNNATNITNVIAAALVVISLVGVGEYYLTASSLNEIQFPENPVQNTKSDNFPDVYYIILDGYAGSESLQKLENYNNNFPDLLSKKGFYVVSDSLSNYQGTRFSVPSTLHMDYIQNIVDTENIDLNDERALIGLARENPVFKNFKSKGYTIFSIESGSTHTTEMKDVDFRLCTYKDNLSQSEFGSMLIQTTMLNPVQTKLFSHTNREKILCGFSKLENLENDPNVPKFVFAHIMLPHRPYIFGPTGEPIYSRILALNDWEEDWDRDLYLGQLEFANLMMMDVVEKLTDNENPPVIIIQSDHGMRYGEYRNDYEFILRNFNNFKAYYFPEYGKNIDFENSTSVNSFRILFNLLGDKYELLEDKIYIVDDENPNQFKDVTDILKKPNF